jgi:hypothetical protein
MTTPNGHAHNPGEDGEQCADLVSVAGLARAVEAVERRVDGLAPVTTRVDELGAMLTRLAQQVSAAKSTGGPSMVAPSWLDLGTQSGPGDTTADAEDILAMLTGWVGGIFLRYSDARLPDCWLWHPDVVEELLWLHAAWLAAYDPDAPWARWGIGTTGSARASPPGSRPTPACAHSKPTSPAKTATSPRRPCPPRMRCR